MTHDCVLSVYLSCIANCLFCVETLAFLAETKPLATFAQCLLTYRKRVILVVVVFMAT